MSVNCVLREHTRAQLAMSHVHIAIQENSALQGEERNVNTVILTRQQKDLAVLVCLCVCHVHGIAVHKEWWGKSALATPGRGCRLLLLDAVIVKREHISPLVIRRA